MLQIRQLCILLVQFVFTATFSLALERNIFLDETSKEEIIESPVYPKNSGSHTFVRWYVDALPRHQIELSCDKLSFAKTDDCNSGMFSVRNGIKLNRYCEEVDNLKMKSIKNRMMIEFWLGDWGFGKFHCHVKSVPEQGTYSDVKPTEIDSKEYDSSLGSKSTTCSCGWRNRERIVGGTVTKINEFPLMASLVTRRTNERVCGGSIITPFHVLTAAHCIIGRMWTPLSVVVGEHDFAKYYETNATEKIDVKYFIQHRNFEETTLDNDIAITVLAEKINFNKNVGPVCLPSGKSQTTENLYVKALGWGQIHPVTRISSNVLRAVNLRIINTRRCSREYYRLKSDTKKQFCTFAKKKDTCQGDSGGPLLWLDPEINRYTQLGLVSYGKTCASEVPAVNTNVHYYMDWIRSIVKQHEAQVSVCTKKN